MFDVTPVEIEIIFDNDNPNWRDEMEYNILFLRMLQNHANDRLIAKGHLFLNDVLDMLDIRRTAQGAIGGWLAGVNGGFIDFGLTEIINSFGDSIRGVREISELKLRFSIIPSMYEQI